MAILFPDLPEPTRVAVHRAVEALERSKRALTAANLSAARAGKQ